MQRIVTYICLYLITLGVKAQLGLQAGPSGNLVNDKQFILPISNETQDVHVINAAKKGIVLLVNEFGKFGAIQSEGVLMNLDTTFEIRWEVPFFVPLGYTLLGWDYFDEQVQLLFSRKQYKKELLSVFKIDLNTGSFIEQKISTVFPIEITHFEALNDFILLAGNANHKSVVVTFNKNDIPHVVPGIYGNENEIVNVIIDDRIGIFSVIVEEKNKSKNSSLTIYGYTRENQKLFINKGVPPLGRNLLNGTLTISNKNSRYLAGSFSEIGKKLSKGLFISKFTEDKLNFLKYYEFAYFENFFEFLGLDKAEKLKDRIKRKTEEGKKINLNYRVIIHEILQRDKRLILTGEVYFPKRANFQTLTPNSSIAQISYTDSGFNHSHAFAVVFDEEGNLLWDHSWPMQDMFFLTLGKKAVFHLFTNRLEVYSLEKNKVRSRIFLDQKVIEDQLEIPISLGVDSDKWLLENPKVESVLSWYDQFILAFGRQRILTSSNINSSYEEIFYLNKIHYIGKEDMK